MYYDLIVFIIIHYTETLFQSPNPGIETQSSYDHQDHRHTGQKHITDMLTIEGEC